MHGQTGQYVPVIILVIIALLVALSAQVVLASNARIQDADITFRANLIIMRIKVREFIANSWLNENTESQHAVSHSLAPAGSNATIYDPWLGMERSDN
jgi:hypothetical protein